MTTEAPEAVSGLRKAAVLLILLGEENSAGLLRQLSELEVQQVAREIAHVESLTPELTEGTLEEFYQLTMGHDFAVRGGLDYARRMLNKAFGPETGKKITDRLAMMVGGEYAHLDALQKADPQQLARFIHNEHPQTIALVLSHLNSTSAAGLLASLPSEIRPEVALRMANLDEITPEIVNKIARVIGDKLQVVGQVSRESYGGARAIAELFNQLDSGTSKEILDVIEAQNPNLVETIRQMMFVFDDLLTIDVNQLKEILARVDRKTLTVALKGTSNKLREHFFSTMSARGVEMLKEDIEALGPAKIKDVEAAQQQIIATVRELEAEGAISLKGGRQNNMLSKVLKGGDALQVRAMAFSDAGSSTRGAARSHSADRGADDQDRRILLEKIHTLEAGLPAAQKDAFDSGYRKGEQSAREALAPVLTRLNTSIGEIVGLRPELRRRAEKDAVELALKIAARILHREMSIDNSALNALARVVFGRMARSESWQLTVHPQFIDAIRGALPQGSADRIRVEADPSCAPGTVIARSADGVVDASVDSQLAEISRGLTDRLIGQ